MEELFQVPPPGQHYSRRWAGDDLHNERGESSRLGEMADPLSDWDKPKDTDEEGFGEWKGCHGFVREGEILHVCRRMQCVPGSQPTHSSLGTARKIHF